MKKMILVVIVFLVPAIYYACGGSDNGGDAATGTVPLYLTDDMGDFKQVVVTLNSVQLVHTDTGTACDLLTNPESVDIANLEGILQLLDTTQCADHSYNRVHLEFEKAMSLMDQDGASADCLFESYKDNENTNQPNVLICSQGRCTISINGGINVIADTVNPFALDFDLKNFEVESFGAEGCSVTLKVEPQNNNDIDDKMNKGYRKSTTGYVSNLDSDGDTFTLTTKKGAVFSVDYSQTLYRDAPQPAIDSLLQFAAEHGLRVRVMTAGIDVTGGTAIIATTIYLKLEGMMSGLDSVNYLFTLENASQSITITVDYSDAASHDKVEGELLNDSWVETKLYGVELDTYLAHEVEVEEEEGPDTDD